MLEPLRVLLVEDREDDAELVLWELRRSGFDPSWERVEDESELDSALERKSWDVILSDHSMPHFSAPKALELVQSKNIDLPFIIVSGAIGEEQAVAAMRAGASDYILKDSLGRLGTAVKREVVQARERSERREADERRRTVERQMAHLASHDRVTGLPNRDAFIAEIENRPSARSGAVSEPLALLHVHFDHFDLIANTFGHEHGERVLTEASKRLLSSAPPHSVVASLGRENFVVLSDCDRSRATAIGREIVRAFEAPVTVEGTLLHLEASIGVALCPDHGRGASELLQRAAAAAQEASRSAKGVAIFSSDRNPLDPEALGLLGELRGAIQDGQVFAEYQPVLDLSRGEVVGAEALARWKHPRLGLISPGRFVPAAEGSGLIHPMFRRMLEQAVDQWVAWRSNGLDLCLAVNLSAKNLLKGGTVQSVLKLLDDRKVPSGAIELEITESSVMADPERAIRALRLLRENGVLLAIDDFGTGFSSFSYLRDLPVDKLKIDRSFVSRMLESEKDAAIVRATIDLAHTLGLRVAAEGVEDEITLDVLAALGCDVVQGYFIARSMPGDGLVNWSLASAWKLRSTAGAQSSS